MAVVPTRENALDHLVVMMFENRSFDSLLGRLYEPGEVASFEGVAGKDLSNPIPEWAEDGSERGRVRYDVAASMNTPSLDPGEEYPQEHAAVQRARQAIQRIRPRWTSLLRTDLQPPRRPLGLGGRRALTTRIPASPGLALRTRVRPFRRSIRGRR